MNHSQRQLIKEAYQEGYYQALYEKSLGKRFGEYLGKNSAASLKNCLGVKEEG